MRERADRPFNRGVLVPMVDPEGFGGRSAMAVLVANETAYVVRDGAGRLVAAFWGSDAPAEVESWTERGYRVEPVERSFAA